MSALGIAEFRQASVAIVLPLLLIFAGCGASGSDEALSPTATPEGQATAPSDAWDVTAWRSTVKVTPPSMTDEEKRDLREEWLETTATELDVVNPPVVDLVRWTTPGDDYGDAVGSCLREAGFDAVFDGFGGFDYPEGIPESQDAANNLAWYECNASYTLDPRYSQQWTDDQLHVLWEYWETFYVPCLEAHDVLVDLQQRPSKDAWVSRFNTPDRISWWPSDSLAGLPDSEREAVEAVCPDYPPAAVFYGSES